MAESVLHFDVLVVGAGPAGLAAARGTIDTRLTTTTKSRGKVRPRFGICAA